MRILLPLLFVFSLHANDQELIRTTHKQLIICILKQDKDAVEKLLIETPQPLIDQVLKTSSDVEACITPAHYAYRCFEIASENVHTFYNNDRINDIILGSLKCFLGITCLLLNPTDWSYGIGGAMLNMNGLIDFKDAYNNTGAEFKAAHAHEIYNLIEKYPDK